MQRPGWLTEGASALVSIGGLALLTGTVTAVGWNSRSVAIAGAATQADTVPCLDATTGQTTTVADKAIDNAIAEDWVDWRRLDSISSTPYGDSEVGEELKGIPDLLGALSDASKRPLVDGRAILRTVADPTAPTLFAYPGVDELSWADGSQARTLVGRWRDSAGSLDNATAGSGRPVQLIDLTGVKALTSTTAANLLESILADLSAGGWSNGLTLARNQFVGRPHLAKVWLQCARGAMIRLPQRDTRPDHSRPMLDVIIESASWDVSADEISIGPRGLVVDGSAVLADHGAEVA